MKIVNRATFLTYPAGTVFCKYRPCVFGELQVKVCNPGTWEPDFCSVQLSGDVWFQGCSGSDEYFDKIDACERGETELRPDYESSSRDGLYEEDQFFAIYDKQDIQALIEKLKQLQ